MTVGQFLSMRRIMATTPDTVEQMGFVIMEIFGKTYDQVDGLDQFSFALYVKRLEKMVTRKEPRLPFLRLSFETNARNINYGQFIEIQYWLQQQGDSALALDLIAASITKEKQEWSHSQRSEWIRSQPLHKVLKPVERFMDSMDQLLNQYKGLFDKEEKPEEDEDDELAPKLPDFNAGNHPFVEQFGWIFSAVSIAEHERIKLDDVYGLPVVQALNDLAYLKSKRQFDEYISKKRR